MCLVDHVVSFKNQILLLNARTMINKLALGYVFKSNVHVLNLAIQGPAIHFHFVQANCPTSELAVF